MAKQVTESQLVRMFQPASESLRFVLFQGPNACSVAGDMLLRCGINHVICVERSATPTIVL